MTTKEKLTRRIVELIHGLPYEEAVKKEILANKCELYGDIDNWIERGKTITIGRVMAALGIITHGIERWITGSWIKYIYSEYDKEIHKLEYVGIGFLLHEIIICNWQLLNDDGSECTLDSQSKETIKALYDLLKEE